jgi:hypothetical protein
MHKILLPQVALAASGMPRVDATVPSPMTSSGVKPIWSARLVSVPGRAFSPVMLSHRMENGLETLGGIKQVFVGKARGNQRDANRQ